MFQLGDRVVVLHTSEMNHLEIAGQSGVVTATKENCIYVRLDSDPSEWDGEDSRYFGNGSKHLRIESPLDKALT